MRRLALCLLVACGSTPAAPRYPLHPAFRSASGGPVEIAGAVERPCAVPWSPGLTLRGALWFAGGPSELGMRDARITRGGMQFLVPVQDIVAGIAPDPELAPGDVVLVESRRIVE
jgi:protein involved in polysaccharide export with SLBB domain